MNDHWPADGLESVLQCPLCDSAARRDLHQGLRDYTFDAAPGSWTMYECQQCRCGYLDPRPTETTIGLAYANYYTHERTQDRQSQSRVGRIYGRVAAGYLNAHFGTRFPDPMPFSRLLISLFPSLRGHLNVSYGRHLGRGSSGSDRLLDVGCGNGEFLECAAAMGWNPDGIDPDEGAARAARASGLRVWNADLFDVRLAEQHYHQITMSHVIEHLHHPVAALQRCFELLAPGGRLWLETPNIEGLGHAAFGALWRGLEPPRHLIIFSRKSLVGALQRAGFVDIRFRSHPGAALFTWQGSRAIRVKSGSVESFAFGRDAARSIPGAVLADLYTWLNTARNDFLTCIASRP